MGVGRYLTQAILLLIVLLGNIVMVFRSTRHFYLELLLILIALLFAMIIFVGTYNKRDWAFGLSAIVYGVLVLNITYLYFNSPKGIIITCATAIVGIIGVIFSLLSIGPKEIEEIPSIEEYERIRKPEEKKEAKDVKIIPEAPKRKPKRRKPKKAK